MKVAYIAGPFRAANAWLIEENIRRAERVALEAWRMGFAVICPHTNTRFFQGAAPDRVWLDGDLEILLRCDLVILVDGWDNSTGALKEVEVARERGIPVYQSADDVPKDCRHCEEDSEGYCETCAAPLCSEHDGGTSEGGPYCAYGFGCNSHVCPGCGCGSPGISRHWIDCKERMDS